MKTSFLVEKNRLHRLKIGLSTKGKIEATEDSIVYLQKCEEKKEIDLLNIPCINKIGKCKSLDPCPLMPCVKRDGLEILPEPIRKRESDPVLELEDYFKNRNDQIDNQQNNLELGTYPHLGKTSRLLTWVPGIGSMVTKQILWREARTVSQTRSLMTVFGMGICGRAYAVGTYNPRYLIIEVYDQQTCRKSELNLSMVDLKTIFGNSTDLLQPGRKKDMVIELCKLCYLKYDLDINNFRKQKITNNKSRLDSEKDFIMKKPVEFELVKTEITSKHEVKVSKGILSSEHKHQACLENFEYFAPFQLRISSKQQNNNAVSERRKKILKKRKETVKLEQEEQLVYMKLPKRRRNLIHVVVMKASGIMLVCMVYVFRSNSGIFVLNFYQPGTCNTCTLNIDMQFLSARHNTSSRQECYQFLKCFLNRVGISYPIHRCGQIEINNINNHHSKISWSLDDLKKQSCFTGLVTRKLFSFTKKKWKMEQPEVVVTGMHHSLSMLLDPISLKDFKTTQCKHSRKESHSCDFLKHIVYRMLSEDHNQNEDEKKKTLLQMDNSISLISCPTIIRRDIGKGERLSSGVTKIGHVAFNFILYRQVYNEEKKDRHNVFLIELYSKQEFDDNTENRLFRFHLDMNDLYRICRDTDLFKDALKNDNEELKRRFRKNNEKVEKINKKISEVFDEYMVKYEKIRNEPYIIEKENDLLLAFRKKIKKLNLQRVDKLMGIHNYQVDKKLSWCYLCQRIFSKCSLYKIFSGKVDATFVNGETGKIHLVASGMLAKTNPQIMLGCTVKLDCIIYRADHLIEPRDVSVQKKSRLFNITAVQMGNNLSFIARDLEKGDYSTFSHETSEEGRIFIESMKLLKNEEIQIQISESLAFLEYYSQTRSNASMDTYFHVSFGTPTEISFDVSISEEDFKKAENYMDDMMALQVRKAKIRERAATERVGA